jgi:hypothetical protein
MEGKKGFTSCGQMFAHHALINRTSRELLARPSEKPMGLDLGWRSPGWPPAQVRCVTQPGASI